MQYTKLEERKKKTTESTALVAKKSIRQ